MEHFFNAVIAKKYDIDTAVFIQHLKYWTFINLAKNHNVYDGLCWSHATLDALTIIFPYWSRRQIERVINNCEKRGLIQKGNYNGTAYDRTCWYALTPVVYGYYPELLTENFLKLLHSTISPNGEIDFAKWRNGFPQTVTPIPNINTDNKTYNTISDLEKSPVTTEVIEEVVSAYHEELPECPKIKVIGPKSGNLCKLISKMIKNWPEYSPSKSKFTLDAFRQYLKYLKQSQPGFLKPYTTRFGNQKRNNLKTLIREDNILKFINEEFDFK